MADRGFSYLITTGYVNIRELVILRSKSVQGNPA